MDLVSLEFRVFLGRCQTHGTPRRSDLDGNFHRLLPRMAKQLFHHADDIIVGVVIVVPQYDMIPRLPLGFRRGFNLFVVGDNRVRDGGFF